MVIFMSKELEKKVEWVPHNLIVKPGCVLTPEEQKEYDQIIDSLNKYGRSPVY